MDDGAINVKPSCVETSVVIQNEKKTDGEDLNEQLCEGSLIKTAESCKFSQQDCSAITSLQNETKADNLVTAQNDKLKSTKSETENEVAKSSSKTSDQKTSLRRNLSINNLRRMFKKQHSRSFSESPALNKQKTTDSDLSRSRSVKSEKTDEDDNFPPVSPGSDSVFGDNKLLPQQKFKKNKTLSRMLSSSSRDSDDQGGPSPASNTESKAVQLLQKIGSFNFSPQNSSADELIFSSVDSVYQVIKEGMDLREKNSVQEMPSVSNPEIYRKKPLTHQLSEPLPKSGLSPTKNNRRTLSSNSSLEFPDDINCYPSSMVSTNVFLRKLSQTPLLKDGEDCESLDSNSSPAKQSIRSNQQQVTLPDFENLYVALHRYDAKQEGDLSLKPGDIIKIIDDKHESWWMGQLENKTGYLPAKFILKLRKKEKIYICVHSTSIKALNDKESTLKKNQIVAVKTDWPVEDDEYFYARTCSMEGYVKKEDLIPL